MDTFTPQSVVLLLAIVLALAALLIGVILLFSERSKQNRVARYENLKILCWMSQSGKLKLDEEGSKTPRLLHLVNLSRFPVFDVVVDFRNEEEEEGGRIFLEALLPNQEELFPVTTWSNLQRPVFRRARITGYSFVDYSGQRWERKVAPGRPKFRKVKPLGEKARGIEVRQVRLPEHKDPVVLYLPPPPPPPKEVKSKLPKAPKATVAKAPAPKKFGLKKKA